MKLLVLLLTIFYVFGIIVVIVLAAGQPAAELTLKVSKDKILNSEIITEYKRDANDFIIEGTENYVMAYSYISNKEISVESDEIIEKRTSNSKTYKTDNPFEFRTVIYASEVFYKETDNKWYKINIATTTTNTFNTQTTSLFKRILGNVYAQNITASSTAGDGWCETPYNTNWDVPHDAANCNGGYTTYTDTLNEVYSISNTAATGYKIARGFLPFDTSAIPSNATITSSTLKIYITGTNNDDNDGDDFIVLVQTSQASSNTLISDDYDQAGAINNPSEGSSRIDIGNITASAYNSWILNATGTAWIKKSGETSNCGTTAGITCLGLREGHDVVDSPLATGGGFIINRIKWSSLEAAGTTQDPLLEITYTVPPSGTVSCSVDNSSTAFGVLSDTVIATSSPNITVSSTCTYSAGCTITVLDAGSGSNPGLWNSTSSALIESSNASYAASSTLVAGTEGYGIRATTTASGSGGTLGIATRYNTGLAGGLAGSAQDVGGLSLSAITLASSTAAVTSREIAVTHKAAIASNTPGGTYSDTITYGCAGN